MRQRPYRFSQQDLQLGLFEGVGQSLRDNPERQPQSAR